LSSDCYLRFSSKLLDAPESIRHSTDQIGCHQALLSNARIKTGFMAVARDIAGKSMKIDGCNHSFQYRLRMLRNDPGNEAGQNVARTSRGHAGIASRVDPGPPVGARNNRSVTFEYEDELMFLRKISGNVDPVPLNCRHA